MLNIQQLFYSHISPLMLPVSTLQGPTFETQGQQAGARVLSWIQRMLTAQPALSAVTGASLGPSKSVVAQTALLHLLSTNVDLFGMFVDQCYATDGTVSRAFFQVRSTAAVLLT